MAVAHQQVFKHMTWPVDIEKPSLGELSHVVACGPGKWNLQSFTSLRTWIGDNYTNFKMPLVSIKSVSIKQHLGTVEQIEKKYYNAKKANRITISIHGDRERFSL